MPYPSRRTQLATRKTHLGAGVLVLGLVLLAIATPAAPAEAAERSVADVVLVDRGAVIDDDLYAAGNRVVVEGRIEGDLLVVAYEDVAITGTGTITGDVTALASSVLVEGTVGESVRVISPRVEVTGEVGGDVMLLGWDATVAATVAGGATLWAWSAETTGTIGGSLEGQMRSLALGGRVGEDVDVTVRQLDVRQDAVVGRDLGYRSTGTATGLEQAEVGGTVVQREPLAPNIRVRALWILAKLVLGLMAAVMGLLVIWAVPGVSERAMAGLGASWWRAWLRGLAVLALPVLFMGLAALLLWLAPTEAGLPLLGVLLPLFLAVVGLVMVMAFLSPVPAFPWLGRLGNQRRGPVRAFLYGTVAVIVVGLVPWLVWLVVLFVIPLGIGGWLSPLLAPPSQPVR